MANWAKEIMILANDFCLDTDKVRQIISDIDTLSVPKGKRESSYKYDRAWARLKPMLIA